MNVPEVAFRAQMLKLLTDEEYDEFLVDTIVGLRAMIFEELCKKPDATIPEIEAFIRNQLHFIGLTQAYPKNSEDLVNSFMNDTDPDSVHAMILRARETGTDFLPTLKTMFQYKGVDSE